MAKKLDSVVVLLVIVILGALIVHEGIFIKAGQAEPLS